MFKWKIHHTVNFLLQKCVCTTILANIIMCEYNFDFCAVHSVAESNILNLSKARHEVPSQQQSQKRLKS